MIGHIIYFRERKKETSLFFKYIFETYAGFELSRIGKLWKCKRHHSNIGLISDVRFSCVICAKLIAETALR